MHYSFWEMDYVPYFSCTVVSIFYLVAFIFSIVASFYLLQVRCFAYAGFLVWMADLLTSPGHSLDPEAWPQ